MNKDNKIDGKTIGILIAIGVVLIILLIYVLTNYGKNVMKDNEEKTNTESTEIPTINRLKNYLSDIKNPISYVILKEASVLKNQTGETLSLKKNVNILASEENKQLLTMEYILKDISNNNKFIILKDNKEDTSLTNPTDPNVLAYYPYSDYNIIYKKLFNSDFNQTNKKISTINNQYDKSNDYVFYSNPRNNTNNLLIDGFTVHSTNYDDSTDKYTASVNMKYNTSLSEKVGTPSDEVTIIYTLVNNEIIIESFMIK